MDNTYSTIKRLDQINDDEYYFGFALPVKDSIYTIYHEAKISAKSVDKLLKASHQLDPRSLIDRKMNLTVPSDSFCLVQFEFDGFFLKEPSSYEVRSDLRLQAIYPKCSDIYSVELRSNSNDKVLDFIISKSTYCSLMTVLDVPAEPNLSSTILPEAEFMILKSEEGACGLKIACSIFVSLKEPTLKAYFTKATTE